MTKLERLTEAAAAAALDEDKIDGLIAYATYLAGSSLYENAPVEIRTSIQRGLDDMAAGRVVDGASLHQTTAARIAAAKK